MAPRISNRIASFIDALPLAPGLRVLEIGCGSGMAAREVSRRIGSGFVLAIDCSVKAIESAVVGSRVENRHRPPAVPACGDREFRIAAG